MCTFDPISLMTVAMGVAQAVSGVQRQKATQDAQRQEEENRAALQAHQAKLKENERKLLAYDAQKKAASIEEEYNQRDGRQISLLAARGVETDSGSALDLLIDSAQRRAADTFAVKEQARRADAQLGYEAGILQTQANNTISSARRKPTPIEEGLAMRDQFAPVAKSLLAL